MRNVATYLNLILWKQPFLINSCDRIRLIGPIINTALMANQPTNRARVTGPAQNACSRAVEFKLIFTGFDYFHIILKYGAKFIHLK